jgi:hypothetical protein
VRVSTRLSCSGTCRKRHFLSGSCYYTLRKCGLLKRVPLGLETETHGKNFVSGEMKMGRRHL